MEGSDMGLIKLNNRRDFNKAKRLIERWSSKRTKRIRFLGRPQHVQPNADKEYVSYFPETLVMESNNHTLRILGKNNIPFVKVDYPAPPTESEDDIELS